MINRIFLVGCILLSFYTGIAQPKAVTEIRSWRQQNEHRLLNEFMDFLSIPNVAAEPASLQQTATAIVAMLNSSGVQKVQLLEYNTPGVPPTVYGEVITPGASTTVVFYAHYDGQPVNPANWRKGLSPFQPTIGNGPLGSSFAAVDKPASNSQIDPNWRVYARGASDDKGGVFAIIQAYKALLAKGKKPSINIKFFFEGEEEAGSPHLHEVLAKYKDLLSSDLWVICDGPLHQSGRKTVNFGVRGDANMELILYGPKKPLHSGHYGNWVPNPAWELVNLLSTMKDEKGIVTIKGFYDDVIPLSDAEKKALAALPPVEEQMKKELGIQQPEQRASSLYESYNYPSLNINGIRSADVGALAANVIPVKATVALDLRLVAGNDWKRQQDKVVEHIKSKGYHVTDTEPTDEDRVKYPGIIQVIREQGYNAQKTPMDLPQARSVIDAVQSTSPDPIVLIPSAGGSLPLFLFEQYLKARPITVPIANHDNNQHAENENIRLGNLWNGIETMAAIMTMK
jgi:acetylornithine deacetylase/succinyl-diaminopimelate desuccinylase-like protein